MAESTPAALDTTESIVIDGANGVTTAPRQHFPDATIWLVGAAIIAGLVRWKNRPVLVAGLLLLGAAPGLVHVLALRADAPLKRGASTAPIAASLAELDARAPWPITPVKVVREDDALFPLGRYAIPGRVEQPGTPLELELRAGPYGTPCREEHVRLICGAGP